MEQQRIIPPNYLTYTTQRMTITDDEIDLRELLRALWKGKWVILAITFGFAVGALLFALSQPNIYKADALIAPAQSSSAGNLAKMAGQLGGLAALAGVNLGGNDNSQTELAVQVIKSRQFLEAFIEKYDLLVPLMAAQKWDLTGNQLVFNQEIYNPQTG
ncbi:LPS O-antigen length regulator, partial [Vibrio cholerae]|nr:LPS O-antigen length regulator [Vibrio cholerae]